eukprot:scaffold26195_cov61-Attheya_sp.AAC.1
MPGPLSTPPPPDMRMMMTTMMTKSMKERKMRWRLLWGPWRLHRPLRRSRHGWKILCFHLDRGNQLPRHIKKRIGIGCAFVYIEMTISEIKPHPTLTDGRQWHSLALALIQHAFDVGMRLYAGFE